LFVMFAEKKCCVRFHSLKVETKIREQEQIGFLGKFTQKISGDKKKANIKDEQIVISR
jgi:hypothetical protein